jgi:hypothetical protein
VSAEDQQRIIDEAEAQSAEIARLQDEAGNKLEAILTAALLATLPSILRAYRRYTSVLTGEDGVQLPRGTVAAYAAANNLSREDATARLRLYQNRPTQAERLRYPGIETAPAPIWQPPA